AAVSDNAVVTEEVPALIQPTVSSQPMTEETVLPVITETVTYPEAEILQTGQPIADSSYLDATGNEGAMCDSIPQEDM
ncbi:MAG: hypothetical protein K6G19_00335, partial [Lachnospiraceae bacterium]|nr:hypothetical protein [Lachnospiraceae bacterium]